MIMDQELRLEQKKQQLETILKAVSTYVDESILAQIFAEINETFPEMDLLNSSMMKISFPN